VTLCAECWQVHVSVLSVAGFLNSLHCLSVTNGTQRSGNHIGFHHHMVWLHCDGVSPVSRHWQSEVTDCIRVWRTGNLTYVHYRRHCMDPLCGPFVHLTWLQRTLFCGAIWRSVCVGPPPTKTINKLQVTIGATIPRVKERQMEDSALHKNTHRMPVKWTVSHMVHFVSYSQSSLLLRYDWLKLWPDLKEPCIIFSKEDDM
jgi:hypothetical protein